MFYAVECGLKCLIMKNTHSNTYEELVRYCNNSQKVKLSGHDIKAMLKEVNPRNEYVLKSIRLKNGGSVQPVRFNELWRYGPITEDAEEEEKAEATLEKIADWVHTIL